MKLHYFNFPGRIAAAKAIFDYASIPYEFVAWAHDDFRKNKDKFPFGQLPVIEFDDGRQLCQSLAVLQYAAGQAGLIPSNDIDCSFAYSAIYSIEDIMSALVTVVNEQDEDLKAQKMKDFQEVILPDRAEKMEKYFKTFGSPGYCVGNKLSFADFCFTAFKEAVDTGMFGETAKAAFDTETYNAIMNTCKKAKEVVKKTTDKPPQ